jgi:uncharacterized protein YukE
MAAKTSPQELMHLAYVLNREAARLDAVRDELHSMVRSTRGEWEGTVADRFRVHAGAHHRQHHLEVARDRLRHAARLVMEAANDAPGGGSGGSPTGGARAPRAGGSGGGKTGGGEG